ncbi:MFS transporter [Leucobacter triazinivorans]|uniref:MFS transporter n=1 Tax=Leucobacter triazinivorans TaxID=1784719 RepID=A0A4P6KHU7_9MICO|nr:MFS transporter [Leucobacter triazinivorans]
MGLGDRRVTATTERLPATRTQSRIVAILALATVLGGLGVGASLSAGALLIVDITGNDALSGLGSTMNAVGAALAGMPLARLAARRGRRIALASGNAIAVLGAVAIIAAAAAGASPLLFAGLAVLGVASAVQLQSRFAATDLAVPENRARDLSLVVWSITIGAVIGPNLITPGEAVGEALGLPGLAGIFVFTIGAQLAAGLVVWIGLRPDPLIESRRLAAVARSADAVRPSGDGPHPEATAGRGRRAQFLVIALIALAHATMVGIMAMTPLHITHHGGSITLVGFTISLHIAGMYALSPVFGMLAGRIGTRPVVLLGFAVLALAAVGAGTGGESMPVIQTALVLLGIGWSMVTVAGSALLTEVTPLEVRPRRQGQSDTIMNAAGAVFGAASGAIFAAGGFPVLAGVAGALIVLGVVATALLRSRRDSVH